MKTLKFKYLYSFKYNNKDYFFLTSKEYPFYFLEYDQKTGNINFPDINTYLDLYDKFQSDFVFTFKDKLTKLKEDLSNEFLNVKPLVRTTSGVLALSIALSLCGCSQTKEIPENIKEETSIEEQVENPAYLLDEVQSYLLQNGITSTKKSYNDDDYYFVKSCTTSSGTRQIYLSSNEEFKELVNIENDPTYDDVIKEFQNNENIPEEEKQIIVDALNNMKNSKELEKLELCVLYTNAKRMSINKIPYDTLKEVTGAESVYAYFETETGKVFIPSDKPFEKFEFIHEVLGHGSIAYRERKDDNLYIYDGFSQIMLPTDNRYTGYSIGKAFSEGGANIIARICVPDDDTKTFYQLFEEELRLIASTCNLSLGELLNNKGEAFYDVMYHNYINYPVRYIIESDAVYNGVIYTEFSVLLESIMLDGIYEEYINASEEEKESIIKSTSEVIRNSSFKDGLHFEYPGGTIDYNPDESADNFEEKIRGVENTR